jgi:murein DD-endopeptidase MepM/ murein hydrolase activator NlpD
MKRIKFFFNPQTLQFERLTVPLRVKLLRFIGMLSAILVTSALVIYLYTRFFPNKPEVAEYNKKMELMNYRYEVLKGRLQELEQQLTSLEQRDNELYRSIFEANPVPDSMRIILAANTAGSRPLPEDILGSDLVTQLDQISARIRYQQKSYEEIAVLIRNQDQKLAYIPAIQPVSNKQLNRIASGFGNRIDPVYGTTKMHKGLDFAAPQGVPIYATGNGVVTTATYAPTGYGNHVVIQHGYGYETLYGHMVRMNVVAGQSVVRGQVIGWVGSTGKSTGPHCHYEVHVAGQAVDPIHFFYNDLTPAQFDQLVKMATTGSAKSFD